uniref:Uncharacterized protein n=1 Tax=Rangifer tarandus platyrhynchus TaxID=3082113 RepID=A0ACB0EDH5_RANTA|nr:unnamed protein product [Rangifer tarandus platyrhynchus]
MGGGLLRRPRLRGWAGRAVGHPLPLPLAEAGRLRAACRESPASGAAPPPVRLRGAAAGLRGQASSDPGPGAPGLRRGCLWRRRWLLRVRPGLGPGSCCPPARPPSGSHSMGCAALASFLHLFPH